MRTTSATLFFALAALGLSACGDKDPVDSGDTEDSGLPDSWQDMDFQQRTLYMNTVVMPTMKAKYQAFDAEWFEDFSCSTCHGAGASDGTYSMPNSGILTLSYENWPQQGDGDVNDFMYDEVLPTMIELLDETEYDVNTQEGFGCVSCHTAE